MRRRLAALLLAGLALAGSGMAGAGEMKDHKPRRSTDLPRPIDPDIPVMTELNAARRAATLDAYDLFIRRHADHPLAETARRERTALAERQRRPG